MKESKGIAMAKSEKRKEKKQKNPCNCGVGKRLRTMRIRNGHTVRYIAGILNLEEDSYRRIEYGINSLSADKANILHKKLGYDLNYIIGGGTSLSVEQEYAASSDGRVIHMLSEVISQLEAIEKKMEQKCGEDCGNRNN
jgi:transcriptional regulator with XRE-family HTH domain